jgi:hypothetical protein
MSLLDLIAAAGEEFIGLRTLGASRASAASAAVTHRARRRFLQAAIFSLLALGACWAVAYLLPQSRVATLAAYGTYASLAVALLSALGWAYVSAAVGRVGPRRGRDA